MKTDKYGHPRVKFSELPKGRRQGFMMLIIFGLLLAIIVPILFSTVLARPDDITLEEYLQAATEQYYERESNHARAGITISILVPFLALFLVGTVFFLAPRDYTKCPNGHVNAKKDKHPYPHCRECGAAMDLKANPVERILAG